ncbi:MAG: glycosyltransferase family 2 protein [Patescibacteria group bacterium]
MKNAKLPTISVVVATHNSSRTIGRCLASIRSQRYPQDRIEIIIADGASRDTTRGIASGYNVRWVAVDPAKQSAEYNKATGIRHAKNEILAMIDHDNVLPHDVWFQNMTQPLLEQKDVVGVETLRYHYDPTTSLLDRYFALFGAGDPLVWYMGKADRLSYIYDTYKGPSTVKDCGGYYTVRFKPETMPTIGANGYLVRRTILMKHAKTSPGMYFDMDVNVDLILKGYDTFAFVKDSILHLTGYGSVLDFLKRRMLFFGQYQRGLDISSDKPVRRYGILSKKGIFELFFSIFICATVIIPIIDSIRGYRKIRDIAWFLHPFLSLSFVVMYSWVIITSLVTRYAKKVLAK